MRIIFAILIIGLFVLAGCAKEEPVVQEVQKPAETQETTTQPVVEQQAPAEPENELLDKIDWDSVEDKSIIFFVKYYGTSSYVISGAEKKWRIFSPIKTDFMDFIITYDYTMETVKRNGKTVYTFTEVGKRERRSTNEFQTLPKAVQDAYQKLLDEYPNLLE